MCVEVMGSFGEEEEGEENKGITTTIMGFLGEEEWVAKPWRSWERLS